MLFWGWCGLFVLMMLCLVVSFYVVGLLWLVVLVGSVVLVLVLLWLIVIGSLLL